MNKSLILFTSLLLFNTNLIGQFKEPIIPKEISGIWGMYKDKHPEGWGTFNPPYYYLILNDDATYKRIYLLKKQQTLIFGTFELTTDSLLVFHESKATDGTYKGPFPADTAKFKGIHDNILEIHGHHYTWLRKRKKPWKHRMKFRRLEPLEQVHMTNAITSLENQYSQIENEEIKSN